MICIATLTYAKDISFYKEIIKNKKNSTEDIAQAYLKLSGLVISKSINESLQYAEEGLAQAEKINSKPLIADAYNCIGLARKKMGDYEKAIDYYKKALDIYKELNDQKAIALMYNRLGVACKNIGEFEKALEYYQLAKEKIAITKDTNLLFSLYNNIGVVQKRLGNYELALKNYFECLQLSEAISDLNQLNNTKNNIGNIYINLGEYDKAFSLFNEVYENHKSTDNIEGMAYSFYHIAKLFTKKGDYSNAIVYYRKAISLSEQLGDNSLLATNYNSIGGVYIDLKQTDSAMFCYENALKYLENSSNPLDFSSVLLSIGNLHYKKENYALALSYMQKAYNIGGDLGDYSLSINLHHSLYTTYEKRKEFEKAFFHLKNLYQLESEKTSEEKEKLLAEQQAIYDSYKKEQEIEVLQKEKALSEAELNKKKITIYAFIAGFVLFLILIVVVIKNNREKSKTLTILEESNTKIVLQKNIIEQKNKDITDSILYAKRIQSAMLNRNENFAKKFKGFFVLYLPKDIVSGDFYWLNENNDSLFFSVADCTGHGVPGAFMSIIGYNSLNAALEKNISSPSEILHFLDERVKNALTSSNNEEMKDGMDIAICKLNKHNNELTFGGAINSAITVYENEINVLKGSKKYIGNGLSEIGEVNFEERSVMLRDGEMVYLASDGFADQFGGEKGKKLKTANYKKLLLDIYKKPLTEQREILLKEFQAWKKDYEQVDDICVLGIRV